ncbi:hypothetical protein FA95DRAFT_1565096 [Auriscalpium vulgare]|uniref:Uncharacterized protein n=1 Tax=Auriscalpium vulgare TaxID=40419 RepID=A0ACB8RC46_9AGAM|nr:hypothetical protein FA95DRAFT_1565096 [Auriscalpium vulgare]
MHPTGVVCAALMAVILPLSFALPLQKIPHSMAPSTLFLSKRRENHFTEFGPANEIGAVDGIVVHLPSTPGVPRSSGQSPIDETPESVVDERDFVHKILSGSLSMYVLFCLRILSVDTRCFQRTG